MSEQPVQHNPPGSLPASGIVMPSASRCRPKSKTRHHIPATGRARKGSRGGQDLPPYSPKSNTRKHFPVQFAPGRRVLAFNFGLYASSVKLTSQCHVITLS
eukprot:3591224-Rhodomonas_salina.1